jgi:hypothetical protein
MCNAVLSTFALRHCCLLDVDCSAACMPNQAALSPAALLCAACCAFLQVTPHARCKVSVTVHTNTETGGDEFFVTGAAVVPYTEAAPVNFIDKLEMASGRTLGAQLPFAWP